MTRNDSERRESREDSEPDEDLRELLALLEEPLDRRVIDRGVSNLCHFLQKETER